MKASMKKMAKGGKMPMVSKDGKKVPAFAADGKGKMMYGGAKKMMTGGMPNPNKAATVSSGPSTGVVPHMNKTQPAPGNSFPTRKEGGAMKKMKVGGMANPNKMQAKPSEKSKTSMVTYKKGGMTSMKKMGKKK
jgi:hypothetical protein